MIDSTLVSPFTYPSDSEHELSTLAFSDTDSDSTIIRSTVLIIENGTLHLTSLLSSSFDFSGSHVVLSTVNSLKTVCNNFSGNESNLNILMNILLGIYKVSLSVVESLHLCNDLYSQVFNFSISKNCCSSTIISQILNHLRQLIFPSYYDDLLSLSKIADEEFSKVTGIHENFDEVLSSLSCVLQIKIEALAEVYDFVELVQSLESFSIKLQMFFNICNQNDCMSAKDFINLTYFISDIAFLYTPFFDYPNVIEKLIHRLEAQISNNKSEFHLFKKTFETVKGWGTILLDHCGYSLDLGRFERIDQVYISFFDNTSINYCLPSMFFWLLKDISNKQQTGDVIGLLLPEKEWLVKYLCECDLLTVSYSKPAVFSTENKSKLLVFSKTC
ncbi:hypothetical protein RCL1_003869 [Eukaryota sp. TZLM3-RCL]